MMRTRRFAVLAAVFLLTSGLALGAQYAPAPVTTFTLPPSVKFPEGIAFSTATQMFYTADAENGTVVEISRKGDATRIVAGPGVVAPVGTTTFPAALGMKVDAANRLWIAGGRTGRMSVLDVKTGKLIRQVASPTAGSLINDVAIAGNAAYFTDTRNPTLWRLAAEGPRIGDLQPWISFADTPIQYDGGNNLNGITLTPDGQYLIVVQMDKGLLFRIEIASQAIRAINTTGIDLSGGDGLVMIGDVLYVVRQPAGEIVALQIQPDPLLAKVITRFRDPALAWPATAVAVENSLVVANSQFNARATKAAREPFSFAFVPLSRLTAPPSQR